MAIVLSAAVAIFGTYLLNAHGRLCALFLKLSAIPVAGLNTLDIFSAIGPAKSPLTEASDWTANTDRTGILFIVSMLILLALHRRFALARNFLVFLMVLLLVSAGIMVFDRSFRYDSQTFAQLWLRVEVLVWLLLPWITAFSVFLLQPSALHGVGWVLAMQAYGFLWSALRMTFCLGMLYYTGVLFLPVLWFALGLLSEMFYILAFYSLSIYHASGTIWGPRSTWKH